MRIALVLLAALTTGCTGVQSWTREEAEAETTRFYRGTSPAEAIAAAERVLRLADGRDVRFAFASDGFTASRQYIWYAILAASQGSYTYQVSAVPEGGGVRLRVNMSVSGAAVLPGVMGGVTTTPATGEIIDYPDPYRLFFSRTDYLLGKRSDWVSCQGAREKLNVAVTEALCVSADDQVP